VKTKSVRSGFIGSRAMLYRFSQMLAGSTIVLILAGSLITSNGAGLSVPDWPTSYGWNMFTFPPSMWVANILYEHGHRLVASAVGALTVVLVCWLWIARVSRWLRWVGVVSLSIVIAQGLLGGLTVLFFLPPAISTAHAALAELFLCATMSIALFTSPRWAVQFAPVDDVRLRRLTTLTTSAVFCQILAGATMRHTGAGLAIPDFPWMFGHVVPDHWTAGIAIHFGHRLGAAIVALAVVSTVVDIWRRFWYRTELTAPSLVLLVLVLTQVTLGAFVVLSHLQPWVNSVHVVVGAMTLATSLVIALRTWQVRFPRESTNEARWSARGGVGRSIVSTTS
jgi:cytochrome c oxidase assembly protein subunit 15